MDEPIIDLHSARISRERRCSRQQLTLAGDATYAGAAVTQPFINISDKAAIQEGIDRAADISLRMASDEIRIPRGVYRFKTLEEADDWMDKMVARSQPQKD